MSASDDSNLTSIASINASISGLVDESGSDLVSDAAPKCSSVVEKLKESAVAVYAATPNLAARAEFFFGGATGDVTILKGKVDDVSELVLSGVFEIDRQGFFMGAEGGYSPKNTFSHNFVDTKLTCNLVAVQHDAVYGSTKDDFLLIISNIRALEKIIALKKGETLVSCVHESCGLLCIRLSHALFTKKDDSDDADTVTHNENATVAWPVQNHLKEALEHAALTHYVSPLLAFDANGVTIHPVDYHHMLCSVIVQVHFTLFHYSIKGDKKSIFITAAHEIHVLHAPLLAPHNPLKCGSLGYDMSTTANKKAHLHGESGDAHATMLCVSDSESTPRLWYATKSDYLKYMVAGLPLQWTIDDVHNKCPAASLEGDPHCDLEESSYCRVHLYQLRLRTHCLLPVFSVIYSIMSSLSPAPDNGIRYWVWGFLFGPRSGPCHLDLRVFGNDDIRISGTQYLFAADVEITTSHMEVKHHIYIMFFDLACHQAQHVDASYVFVCVRASHMTPLHIRAEDDLQDILHVLLVLANRFPAIRERDSAST
ncbi:hypothetical protein BKA82DRAFT_25961 [Pisolithus tinctorius]|uniref:Uncharacterized protein n=1 Tax=Pisolithus tinctorius Marx 270 TaxID=870435 RepID=A0A0C3J776_PISTI|nr:hypothetical protein BKA82DRAFT_25961 [Pisolithus tinctorius]KIO04878.1 hypothetical protein M404DRAFT_25961 [Pisolithus tinctorius Marx 270]